MLYGILDKTNSNKFAFIDEDKNKLVTTTFFLTDYSLSDMVEVDESEVEQGSDSSWYMKGYAPKVSVDEIQEEIDRLQAYLDETDWYIVRMFESGKMVPEEIRYKRDEARQRISELREKKV